MISKAAWIEISVKVGPEACEAVAEILGRYGKGGAVIETLSAKPGFKAGAGVTRVKAYLPARQNSRRQKAIRMELNRLKRNYPIFGVQIRELKTDWTEGWKKGYQPHQIGNQVVITPTWKKYRPQKGKIVIWMDPGMAFGTGLHPTTRLCLIALEKYLKAGDPVLDVGTGSGILAIVAAKLGASRVTALDIEETAVEIARKNVSLNGVSDRVELRTGILEKKTGPDSACPTHRGEYPDLHDYQDAAGAQSKTAPWRLSHRGRYPGRPV